MTFFFFLYGIAFFILTWRRFSHGVFLLFLLLPTYLLRFSLGPLPTTFLEIMVWSVCLIAIIKEVKNIEESLLSLFSRYKVLSLGILFFLAGATLSLITAVDLRAALGAWKAFYIEPIALFFVLYLARHRLIMKTDIIIPLLLSGVLTAGFAVYQHVTGVFVPYAFWENNNTYRVTGWYGFPNAVGLFLAPLVVVATGIIGGRLSDVRLSHLSRDLAGWNQGVVSNTLFFLSLVLLPLGTLAVVYAKSTGAIIAILGGIGIFLLLSKRTRKVTIGISLVAVLVFLLTPQLGTVRKEVFMQDRSGQIRLSIWSETATFLKVNPLLGAGLASYSDAIAPYHTTVNGEGIEIFHHPHNIFLTIWVNLGLIGLIGFLCMLLGYYLHAPRMNVILIAGMTAILITGLVDSPYIKNDLAILFWVFPLIMVAKQDDFV